MKKFTKHLLSIALLLALVLSFAGCGQSAPQETPSDPKPESNMAETAHKQEAEPIQPPQPEAPPAEPVAPPEPVSMNDALFIGDSRVTGLMEYSGLSADFFTCEGMSVYNIHDKPLSVPNVGKMTLTELLSHKSYGKIYVMLGINELGYNLEQTIGVYSDLVNTIRELQPNATLFIMGNLHVTEAMSTSHSYIKNSTIDAFNNKLSQMANGETIFYMDVNSEFDDGHGNLAEEYTSDGAHPYAKHYIHWGEWIAMQSAFLIKEE